MSEVEGEGFRGECSLRDRTKEARDRDSGTSFIRSWKDKGKQNVGLPRWEALEDPEVKPFFLQEAFTLPASGQHAYFIIPTPQGVEKRQKGQESVAFRIFIFTRVSSS